MAGMKLQGALSSLRRRDLPAHIGTRLAWEGRRAWRRIGPGAALGLLCAGLALAALWHANTLAQPRELLAAKLRAVRSSVAAKPANEDRKGDIAEQLAAFYAYLPAHEAIPDQLKQLINLAQKSGVTLAQAEYKPQSDSHANFLRYQITLPVKADYPNVQKFIVLALQELPTLTLESVAFKRDRIDAGEVDARIQYVLLVRKSAATSKGMRE